MFELIKQLQELIKSYYIALRYDTQKANTLLQAINQIRLEIALDAEIREVFWEQKTVPFDASGFQQNVWFSKDDINYIVNRILASLETTVQVAAVNQGNRQRIITREFTAWQHLFPAVQSNLNGQQTLFDFPQEIFFSENETLGLSIQGQTAENGFLFYHGCTLKDTLEETRRQDIADEITKYIPEPQLIPIIFQFPSITVGSAAVSATGDTDIFSAKCDKSVILTHVSTTATASRINALSDTGRNQLLVQGVEMAGVAANFQNNFESYYRLPFPHLLRRGDRLKLEALQGSLITAGVQAINTLNFLTFKGYSM